MADGCINRKTTANVQKQKWLMGTISVLSEFEYVWTADDTSYLSDSDVCSDVKCTEYWYRYASTTKSIIFRP